MLGFQTRLRDRPLASARTQESRTNQVSERATGFMGGFRQEVYAVPEQEPGHACRPCPWAVDGEQGKNDPFIKG
ncbi:hypothetical protein BK652_00900 [Pseudomonas brassicacearum]|uniref:Uncharacterized protein n=1 Tax=Pseudomonas brassicacearum TaxID=930166 RepID=A0A423GHY5_9PSED|nr:hypothetical protein BK652_00900 [Pseudomonas brassicacearum]